MVAEPKTKREEEKLENMENSSLENQENEELEEKTIQDKTT